MALTVTTSKEITTKAGAGANSDITASGAWIVEIGEQAEKIFCTDTRRDWIGDWSSVDSSVQGKVSQAVSALAAMEIIAYDVSAFLGETEQQTKLDVLSDIYNRAVTELGKNDPNLIRGVSD